MTGADYIGMYVSVDWIMTIFWEKGGWYSREDIIQGNTVSRAVELTHTVRLVEQRSKLRLFILKTC
jgi:hypothetical protein